MTERDQRDLRDPQAMGRLDEQLKEQGIGPATVRADMIANMSVANYPGDESTVQFTIPAFIAEMQEKAATNDPAALRVLLDHGWALPQGLDQEVIERALRMGSADDEVVD